MDDGDDLLRRFRDGDPVLWEILYTELEGTVRRRLSGFREYWRDYLHGGVALALEKRETVRDAENLGGWIWRVIRNHVLEELRRMHLRNSWLEEKAAKEDNGRKTNNEREHEQEDLRRDLWLDVERCRRKIPEDCREVFDAVLADKSMAEIEEMTGLSPGTVRNRRDRAFDALCRCLEAYNGNETDE